MAENQLSDSLFISTDRALLDLAVIHEFLSTSYWAKAIPREIVRRLVEHSLCFGVYERRAADKFGQVGFARIISDYTTFAYLADVFILPEYRGKGLSKALMETILAHPDLQGLRRWMLVTLDAHGLYEQFGFKPVAHPKRHMEIHHPGIYEKNPEA